MNYSEFKKVIQSYKRDNSQEAFTENKKDIRVKKEKTVVKNLERIFDATLKIGNAKGFHAMSMRDLSEETSLSMGALYAYFKSKENLLVMLQKNGRDNFLNILRDLVKNGESALEKLQTYVKTHLFMSEAMQARFYFTYMEGKNLKKAERKLAVEHELEGDHLLTEILVQGEKDDIFKKQEHNVTSALIKAMLNDWYLKRWKYAKLNVSVDDYAVYVLDVVEAYCSK